ncbi:MAG: hypothetical protein ACMG57_05410 [Candidatus Dojkabacteria bacterium]
MISQLFRDAILRHTDDINDVLNWEDFGEGATFAGTILYNIDTYLSQLSDEMTPYEIKQVVNYAGGLIQTYFVDRKEFNDEDIQKAENSLREAVEILRNVLLNS